MHIIATGSNERLEMIAERDFATISGTSLESYFSEILKEIGKYTRLGYWHDRNGYDIIYRGLSIEDM